MEIKTNHKLGDSFWLIKQDSPQPFEVEKISVDVRKLFVEEEDSVITRVIYEGRNAQGYNGVVDEKYFYETKQALFDSFK